VFAEKTNVFSKGRKIKKKMSKKGVLKRKISHFCSYTHLSIKKIKNLFENLSPNQKCF
jgi:hypothetical protein